MRNTVACYGCARDVVPRLGPIGERFCPNCGSTDLATAADMEKVRPSVTSLAAAALRAHRTAKSTPEERSAQAKHAATSRWSARRKSVMQITLDGQQYSIPLDWLKDYTTRYPDAPLHAACHAWAQQAANDDTPPEPETE